MLVVRSKVQLLVMLITFGSFAFLDVERAKDDRHTFHAHLNIYICISISCGWKSWEHTLYLSFQSQHQRAYPCFVFLYLQLFSLTEIWLSLSWYLFDACITLCYLYSFSAITSAAWLFPSFRSPSPSVFPFLGQISSTLWISSTRPQRTLWVSFLPVGI